MDELYELLGIDKDDPTQRLANELNRADLAWIRDLANLRKQRKLSQAELAKLMGRTQSAVSEIESMSTDPRLSTLRRYAIAVGAAVEHVVRDTVLVMNSESNKIQTTQGAAPSSKLLRAKKNTGYKSVGRQLVGAGARSA